MVDAWLKAASQRSLIPSFICSATEVEGGGGGGGGEKVEEGEEVERVEEVEGGEEVEGMWGEGRVFGEVRRWKGRCVVR